MILLVLVIVFCFHFLQARNAYDADNEREHSRTLAVRVQGASKENYKGVGLRVLCRNSFLSVLPFLHEGWESSSSWKGGRKDNSKKTQGWSKGGSWRKKSRK